MPDAQNGQHLWRDCYNNRNGRNYHAPNSNGGGHGNGGNKHNNDAHHDDDAGGKKSKAKNKTAEINFVISAGNGLFESDRKSPCLNLGLHIQNDNCVDISDANRLKIDVNTEIKKN